jgi:hypothetical protein
MGDPLRLTDPTGLYPTCYPDCDDVYQAGTVVENQHGTWTYSGDNQFTDADGNSVSGEMLLSQFSELASGAEANGNIDGFVSVTSAGVGFTLGRQGEVFNYVAKSTPSDKLLSGAARGLRTASRALGVVGAFPALIDGATNPNPETVSYALVTTGVTALSMTTVGAPMALGLVMTGADQRMAVEIANGYRNGAQAYRYVTGGGLRSDTFDWLMRGGR